LKKKKIIMQIIKLLLISIFFLLFSLNANGKLIEIKVKVQGEIITNLDIEDEINYLTFLNPKLRNLENKKALNIAKNSLITEIVKKKELEKFTDLEKKNNLVDLIENNLITKKNIKSKSEFKKILSTQGLDYEKIKRKLLIEALWNQLIYTKYSKNLVINKSELRNRIQNQIDTTQKKYEYNLSEIVFEEEIDLNLENKIKDIEKSINNIGFENTANIFSISNTAKNGGLIGWINELQISKKIVENIEKIKEQEISKPIKIGNSYIIIKINKKKELKNKIDLEKELEKLINFETNRQLNNYSIIFYKRLKKNLDIDEY
tara:strand:- start:2492 stop:3445 length:954 start_codon:yes stop_codon:yes gene_type:complete